MQTTKHLQGMSLQCLQLKWDKANLVRALDDIKQNKLTFWRVAAKHNTPKYLHWLHHYKGKNWFETRTTKTSHHSWGAKASWKCHNTQFWMWYSWSLRKMVTYFRTTAWENNGGSFLLDITLRFYWNHCSNQHSRGYCTLNSGFPLCLNSAVPSTPEQCMVWHKTQKSTLCAACAASKIIHPMHISPGKQ